MILLQPGKLYRLKRDVVFSALALGHCVDIEKDTILMLVKFELYTRDHVELFFLSQQMVVNDGFYTSQVGDTFELIKC